MNKITGDMAKMAAQVPALFEALSGMQMSELFSKVRGIGDKAPKPDELPPANDKDKKAKGAGA
jgi:flotillin